jgi:hypothetical protein
MVYYFVAVFLETHVFKMHYTYFMVSLSLLFVFIQFLGGWFLRQYKNSLNNAIVLNTSKPILEKYLLAYFVVIEFTNEENRVNYLSSLLNLMSAKDSNSNSHFSDEPNFAKDVLDSLGTLNSSINRILPKS